MRTKQNEQFKGIPKRITATLPNFLANQKSSPFHEIHTQLNYLNQSALYSVTVDERYREVKKQIQSIRLALESEKESSQRLSLLRRLIKLENQRKQFSVSWDIFIEHQRWSSVLKNENFWRVFSKRVIAGEEKAFEQLKQKYMRPAVYLNHDAYALQYAAQHILYCQRLVENAVQSLKENSRSYSNNQKQDLVR